MEDNKSVENINNEQQIAGTLNYLKKFRKRRNSDESDIEILENKNDLSEQNIDNLHSLEEATNLIKRIDNDVTKRWFLLAHALKKVRDEKLYEERFSSFQDYFSSELGYSKRMVYYFINLADSYPIGTQEKLLELGVKKLLEIAELPEEQRVEYVENNDVSQMSAAAIKRDIKNKKKRIDEKREDIQNQEYNSGSDVNHSTGINDNISSTNTDHTSSSLGISISHSELKAVTRYYKLIKSYTELVEKFKADQENSMPVEKTVLSQIQSYLLELDDENKKFMNLINNYKE